MTEKVRSHSEREARARLAHELHEGHKTECAITILCPPSELFSFWRDFSNLPKFMRGLESVTELSPTLTRWRWQPQEGQPSEWDCEVIAELKNRMISWQSLPGSPIAQAGSVWFRPAPQDGGSEVHVQAIYRVPGGRFTKKLAEFLGGDPAQCLASDLRRLKSLLETGEVPSIDGQPHGSASWH